MTELIAVVREARVMPLPAVADDPVYRLIARWIARYYRSTRSYTTRRFIIELALAPFVPKFLVAVIWEWLAGLPTDMSPYDTRLDPASLVLLAVFAMPLVETVACQWFFLWMASFWTRRTGRLVAIPAVVFAALHYRGGYPEGVVYVSVVLPMALILSWSFLVRRRERGRWNAIWVTACIHALHNAVSLLILLTDRLL
ncbi:MAG: CPBP family glutamic-type intramembrane protease [bacterium]|nr:CPBP family glutamic-type intramembrane protease [bacterium]